MGGGVEKRRKRGGREKEEERGHVQMFGTQHSG